MAKIKTVIYSKNACVKIVRVPDFDLHEIFNEADLESVYEAEPLVVLPCANKAEAKKIVFEIVRFMKDCATLPDAEFKARLSQRFRN